MTRYAELQQLVANYGEATTRLRKVSHRFGDAILDGLPAYLGCHERMILGVPPVGEFRPGEDYRDACYSFYYDRPMLLTPVQMGLYVEIAPDGRRGGPWVVLEMAFWIEGDDMIVTIHRDGKRVTVPITDELDLTPVFEEIYLEVRRAFSTELDEASPKQKMGFIERP